jgi:hypothetical protein
MKRKEEKEEREEREGKSVGMSIGQSDMNDRVDKGREERDRERDLRGRLL